MGLFVDIKTDLLKETEVKGYAKCFKLVLWQWKQKYLGISIYKVFAELQYNGETYDILGYNRTYSRKKSDKFFSMLERKYPEERLKRKRFMENRK